MPGIPETKGPTRAVIADDHPPTRAGVRASLEDGGITVVAEVGDAKSAVKAVEEHAPDVALLDVHMPGGGGIFAAGEICKRFPATTAVMLTVSKNDEDLFDALRAGAVGYLLKDTDPDRLAPALFGVLRGEAAIPRSLVATLVDEFRGQDHRRSAPELKKKGARLTSREWEVLELLRQDLSTQEVAERLFVSPVTVRSHVSGLLKKLGVPDRDAAVRLFQDS